MTRTLEALCEAAEAQQQDQQETTIEDPSVDATAVAAAAAAAVSTANPILVVAEEIVDGMTSITPNPIVSDTREPNDATGATVNTSTLDFNMEDGVVVPALPTLKIDASTSAAGKMNDEENERIQQEAIAAAVVAQGHSSKLEDGVSGDAESTSDTKGLRKRGWVKKTWDERLEELRTYKSIHGHSNVPTICKVNPSLGHWVHDQRKQYRLYQNNKQTSMNPLRIAQLEEVGFKWSLQKHTTMKSWSERFAQLQEYKNINGHCNVPIRYKTNPSLGQWVSTQRQEYASYQSGKKSNMTKERIAKLEAAEFNWSLRDTAKMAPRKSWDMHFAALKEFKKQNGHCDVRVRSKQQPTGSLGRWVEKQRSQYHSKNEGKDSKLTIDQIERLDSIGFKWRIRHERSKISGCPRNPDIEINDEALLDEYTKRALEDKERLQTEAEERAQTMAQEIAVQMEVDSENEGTAPVSMEAAAVAAVEAIENVPAPVSVYVKSDPVTDVFSDDHNMTQEV